MLVGLSGPCMDSATLFEEGEEDAEQVLVEVVNHLIFHDPQGLEGGQLLFIGPGRSECVVNISDGTDSPIEVNFMTREAEGVAAPVFPLVVLHDNDTRLLAQVMGIGQEPVALGGVLAHQLPFLGGEDVGLVDQAHRDIALTPVMEEKTGPQHVHIIGSYRALQCRRGQHFAVRPHGEGSPRRSHGPVRLVGVVGVEPRSPRSHRRWTRLHRPVGPAQRAVRMHGLESIQRLVAEAFDAGRRALGR